MKSKKLSSLLFILGAACMLIMLACSAVLTGLFWQSSSETAKEHYSATLQAARDRVQSTIEATVRQLSAVGYSEDLIRFMKSSPGDAYERQNYVRTTFDSLRLLNESLLDVYLCFGDGHVLYTTFTDEVNHFPNYRVFLKARDYFKNENTTQVAHSPCYQRGSMDSYAFAIYIPIYDMTVRDAHGYFTGSIIALYSTKQLCEMTSDFPIAIEDSQGQIVFGMSEQEVVRDESGRAMFAPEWFRTLEETYPQMGWRFIGGYTQNLVTQEFGVLLRWMLLAMVLMALVLALLCLLIYRSILDPVRSIVHQLDDIENSDTRIQSVVEERNELMVLTDGINGMLSRLTSLNNQLVMHERVLAQMKLSKMSEKLLLLQSQINPHFLYNNLECIRGMVAMGELDEILEMTNRMASIYRYCVKDQSVATLSKELENLQDYFAILTLRYFGAYQLTVDVPEELMKQRVPRMILQPIVENAVLHGMKAGKHAKGNIHVCVRRKDEKLLICVADDGAGMLDETMQRLNSDFTSADASSAIAGTGRIGLHNINLRLKVLFGRESGIELRHNETQGIQALICIDESNAAKKGDKQYGETV